MLKAIALRSSHLCFLHLSRPGGYKVWAESGSRPQSLNNRTSTHGLRGLELLPSLLRPSCALETLTGLPAGPGRPLAGCWGESLRDLRPLLQRGPEGSWTGSLIWALLGGSALDPTV